VTSTRVLFVLLAVGAGGAVWLKSWLEDSAVAPEPELTAVPGFYMLDADIVALGEDGQPVYHLNATRLEQQGEDQPATLEEIRIEYDPRTGIDWVLTAPHGEVSADLGEVWLDGGVEIVSSGEAPVTRMLADNLTVQIETHMAMTDGPVEISQGETSVEAVGLLANLMDQTVRLQSRVHGQYSP
jgi:LPS export ABC transporter protein LptC